MSGYVLYNPHLAGDAFLWEAGPVGVCLSHGFTATTAEVRLFARRLYEKGFSVGAPLLAGHGSRPEDLNRVRWQDWVESGETVYRQLASRCDKIFLGGESMGALVALYLAGRHPEASGVLLYAPAIQLTISAMDKVRLYLGANFMPFARRENMEVSDKWQGYHPELPTKGILQLLKFQDAVKKVLPNIAQPIVIFQGRKDTTVHPQAGDIILRGVASAVKERHWMERSGHPILIDAELEEVANLSLNFMERALA
jgi:carboxylesterase